MNTEKIPYEKKYKYKPTNNCHSKKELREWIHKQIKAKS